MNRRASLVALAALIVSGCVSEEQARERLTGEGLTEIVLTETRSSWNSGEWSYTARDEMGRDCTGVVQVDWSPGGGDWGAETECTLPTDPARLAAMCTDGALPDACAFAALRYRDGEGTPIDVAQSFALASTGCTAGSAASCFYEGYAHARGVGTAVDLTAAARCYRTGCDGGEQAACNNLGELLIDAGDHAGALDVFGRGCRLGSQASCHERAALVLVHAAERTEAEVAEAAALELRDCESSSVEVNEWRLEACNNAGFLLEHGVGMAADRGRASAMYQRGCEGGHAMACRGNAMLMYTAVPPQPALALTWFRRACEGDDAIGCRNVGVVLRDGGEGVERDAAGATAMFERACALGDAPSCEEVPPR